MINTITKGKEVAVATFDDFKDVFNVKLDPAIAVSSIVLTNQDGFNYIRRYYRTEDEGTHGKIC